MTRRQEVPRVQKAGRALRHGIQGEMVSAECLGVLRVVLSPWQSCRGPSLEVKLEAKLSLWGQVHSPGARWGVGKEAGKGTFFLCPSTVRPACG